MEEEKAPSTESAFAKLNERQKAFVLAYVDCLVGAEAIRRSGYKEDNADVTASQLLGNISIKAAISEISEQTAMSAGEAVWRMSRWAAGSMGTFMDEAGNLILTTDEAIANRHLIKKYKAKTTRRYDPNTETSIEETTIEFELYDAKDATDKMLQLHGRYKQLPGGGGTENEKTEYEFPDGTKIRF